MTTRTRNRFLSHALQTTVHLGAERAAWLAARAEADGCSRGGALLALWPRDAAGGLSCPRPRHPRAPMPLAVRGMAREGLPAVVPLNGPAWIAVAEGILVAVAAKGWTLSAVARAVIDQHLEDAK
jgi:hypothetical protein